MCISRCKQEHDEIFMSDGSTRSLYSQKLCVLLDIPRPESGKFLEVKRFFLICTGRSEQEIYWLHKNFTEVSDSAALLIKENQNYQTKSYCFRGVIVCGRDAKREFCVFFLVRK